MAKKVGNVLKLNMLLTLISHMWWLKSHILRNLMTKQGLDMMVGKRTPE